MSLLHEIVAGGDIERLYEILDQNRHDKNERDEDWEGRTPLFWAVYNEHFDCVKVLLQAGANPTILTHNGKSPAHCAAATGDCETLKLLVDYGCDIRTTDKHGDTAFDYALMYGNLECGEFLARVLSDEYTPKVDPRFWTENKKPDMPKILNKYLTKKTSNINVSREGSMLNVARPDSSRKRKSRRKK